ncbi:MAG TPA: ABC transporter substrate-binding protein [Ornithinimicrobium sp.]|uniref:ABC transporter substrate-binding protein n=1 Tax=Ornithinimicrobium sp. TaxID=1977084 RepID=UPI002B4680C4|nr:ABC transporter substrate-binding protein [Ornithinimicrobium sp.]HKJ13137.1 ABC transporter substrate-binding protein [Ornithinimicrobium sp.]
MSIATDPGYPPNEFLDTDGQTIVGMDIDLFDAVADELDLRTDYTSEDFESIITEVNKGNYDIGVSSFNINEERKLEVTMVSYFTAGTRWAVPDGNPKQVDPQAPCGLAVSVKASTVQGQRDLPTSAAACLADGEGLQVLPFGTQEEATSALLAGEADAMVADSPVISYATQQHQGEIEAAGKAYDTADYGYVISRDNPELADAIQMALVTLADEGTYGKVLEKWGQSDGAINDFAINP